MNAYWAQQECETAPACFVQPRDSQQLCVAVTILKGEYDKHLDQVGKQSAEGIFAVKGGGHSPVSGGLSFFSPRFGLVCSNVIEYEIVLASSAITTVSASKNPDLWRALKGGSNNFSIVTRFTLRSFPSSKIWSGFLYLPSFQAKAVLQAFYDYINVLDPSGNRQIFSTTTIKNDLATINSTHACYQEATTTIRKAKVTGLVWSLVLQPLLPEWVRKGDPNPLGLHDTIEGPLVVVSFNIHWNERRYDEIVKQVLRHTLERIEAVAAANETGHPWRYLNYCAEWQKPIESYGEENCRFLRETSRKYDPDGLFQKGCVGGFKLEMD
ncbi:MAG: hypothetical protein Q9227_003145 [Pyrenula ochraceoflavens]